MQLFMQIEGNIANDVELRYLPDGTAVCNLRVMYTARRFDRAAGEWRDGATTTFDVSTWNKLAEHVAEGFKKGDEVAVTADSLVVRRGGDQNQYVNLDVRAKNIALSARRHPAVSNRPAKTDAPAGSTTDDPYRMSTDQPVTATAAA